MKKQPKQNTSNIGKGLEWEKDFLDRYEGANTVQSSISSFMAKDMCNFIRNILTQQRTELLEEILEENFCDLDGTYDYDGIAESVIKLAKKL